MHPGILKKSGFCVAFHSGLSIATEVTKGTRRCMLPKPPKNTLCLSPLNDDSESNVPKPACTAQVTPPRATAAGKGTPSSSKKAKEKGKESDKAEETDNEDGDREEEGEDLEQVLETQLKRKRAPASHFDASPDDAGKEQPKVQVQVQSSSSHGVLVVDQPVVPLPPRVEEVNWQET